MRDETKRIIKIVLLAILCFSLVGSALVFGPVKQSVVGPAEPVIANINFLTVGLTVLITGLFVFFLLRSGWSPLSLANSDVWILKNIKKTPRKSKLQEKYVDELELSDRNFRKSISKLKSMKYVVEDGKYLKLTEKGKERVEAETKNEK